MPDALLVAVAPVTVPPPLVTVNVTTAPATGVPFWSDRRTEGRLRHLHAGRRRERNGRIRGDVRRDNARGPDESPPPPHDNCNASSPTGGSEEMIFRSSFMIGISARWRSRQYASKAKATKREPGQGHKNDGWLLLQARERGRMKQTRPGPSAGR